MKVGILGAGNCYALNLANHLHAAGIECFGIGRRAPKAAPFWLAPPDYNYQIADIVEHPFIVKSIFDRERPDVVVNFAAQGEGAASFAEHATDFYRTNCWGLARIVDDLRRADHLRHFIHISTSELYGSTAEPAKESDPLRPTSPYAISKAAFDQHLEVMRRIHGFPATIIRPSNCYCPGQQLHRIIPKAIVCARSGRKLPLEGGGKARKSYLHADDLSSAIVAVINQAQRPELMRVIYNVGPNASISIGQLVENVAYVCGVTFGDLVEMAPDRIGQDAHYQLDSLAICADLEWVPSWPILPGIKTVVDWVDNFPELLTMPTGYSHCR